MKNITLLLTILLGQVAFAQEPPALAISIPL
jgi:hypothetical protein